MTSFEVLLILAMFCVWLYGLTDAIQPRHAECRTLSRGAWIPIVFFCFAPGAVAWLVLGRPPAAAQHGDPGGDHESIPADVSPEVGSDVDPETIEAFRARVRARAEEQRRRYAEQQEGLLE